MSYSVRKTLAITLTASALAHGVAIYPESISYPAGVFRRAASSLIDRYERYSIRKERAQLIEDARKGRIGLGNFLIKGNHLDARERGEQKDAGKAMKKYDGYMDSFSRAIGAGKQPYESIPEIMSGMNYFGIPGGEVLDALNDNGGSCAQLAPLLAAMIYDANYTEQAFIRTYGANAEGLSHDTAIYRDEGGVEYDLQKGSYSDGRGVLIPAKWLVEAYAKAHGLPYEELKMPEKKEGDGSAERIAKHKEKKTQAATPPGKPTGLDLPRGDDDFEGSAPLFAKNAVPKFNPTKEGPGGIAHANPGKHGGGEKLSSEAPGEKREKDSIVTREERQLLLSEFLNIANIARLPSSNNPALIRVHPVYALDDLALNRLSILIEKTKKMAALLKDGKIEAGTGASAGEVKTLGDLESFLSKKPAAEGEAVGRWKMAIALGALSGLLEEAEWNFRLAGRHALAEASIKEREAAWKEAGPVIESLRPDLKNSPSPEPWFLTYLGPAGDEALAGFISASPAERKPLRSLAVMLAKEQTRQKALEMAGKLRKGDQTTLFGMMEGAEAEGQEDTLRAYSVFGSVTQGIRLASRETSNRPAFISTLGEGESTLMGGISIKVDAIETGARARVIATLNRAGMKTKDSFALGVEKRVYFNGTGVPGLDRGFAIKLVAISEQGGKKARFEVRPEGGAQEMPIQPEDSNEPKVAIMGVLKTGESLNFPGFKLMIQEIVPGHDGRARAMFRFVKDGELLIGGYLVADGEIGMLYIPSQITYSRDSLRVRVSDIHEDSARVEVLAENPKKDEEHGGEAFVSVKDRVARLCDANGLGEEWKLALTLACSEWALENAPGKLETGARFNSDLASWVQVNIGSLTGLFAVPPANLYNLMDSQAGGQGAHDPDGKHVHR